MEQKHPGKVEKDRKQFVMKPADEEKEKLLLGLEDNALKSGYFLNPDKNFNLLLMNGLLVNENRYGYRSCPCRLASGKFEEDQDIICPCDYRDPDLTEFGMCYCALYVSEEIAKGKKKECSIPERRNTAKKADTKKSQDLKPDLTGASGSDLKPDLTGGSSSGLSGISGEYPVWRCKVCGYLCARENPPELCPICKAQKERFERF